METSPSRLPSDTPEPPSPSSEKVLPWGTTDLPAYLAGRVRVAYRVWKEGTRGKTFHVAKVLWFVQWFVRLFLTNPSFGLGGAGAPRGLLVYHPMGMGKTRLAAAAAIALIGSGYEPMIIAKQSLLENMRKTVKDVQRLLTKGKGGTDAEAERDAERVLKRFGLVTADAHNMAEQIARVAQGLPARKSDAKKTRIPSTGLAGSLNRRVVIVDEAHNLFRAVINASSDSANARRFYAMAMSARDVRFLFLTGTPASKDPFELVPCFNMLAGRELLPTDYETFYRLYVDKEKGEVLKENAGRLANRLLGYVTHVDHMLPRVIEGEADEASEAESDPGAQMPRDEGTTVVRVEMAPMQYRRYVSIREREEAEASSSGDRGEKFDPSSLETFFAPNRLNAELCLPGRDSGPGTYYMKSRGQQNVDRVVLEEAAAEGKPPPAEASPKIADMVRRMQKARGPAVVYSQFAAESGARAVATYLKAAGYSEWKPSEAVEDIGVAELSVPPVEERTYAFFTGEIEPELRKQLVREWNSPSNARGGVIFAVIISGAGAEGLDLKYVRDVYLLEPYWDRSRELQVKHRGIRMGSHALLPEADRSVKTWIYVAVANRQIYRTIPAKSRIEEKTVDQTFLERGVKKYKLSESFRSLLKQVSIECIAFNYGSCRTCKPDGMPLYLHSTTGREAPDAEADTRRPDPCLPPGAGVDQTEVDAREVRLPDDPNVYAVARGASGPVFYVRDSALDAFVELPPGDPRIGSLGGL
jgi:hypothetical protein